MWATDAGVVKAEAAYAWSEDFNDSLNFLFWLRSSDSIDDLGLMDAIEQWARSDSTVEQHVLASEHGRWPEYLPAWQAWKSRQVARYLEQQRLQKPHEVQAHYREMAKLGVKLRVQWVMAPIGHRWLLPPDLAILGVEAGTTESQRAAVLEAAQMFHGAAGDWKSLK